MSVVHKNESRISKAHPYTFHTTCVRETARAGDHDSHSEIQFNRMNRANLRKDKETAIEKRIGLRNGKRRVLRKDIRDRVRRNPLGR